MKNNAKELICAILAALCSFFISFSCLYPGISFWDSSEFINSAYWLQPGHPPGSPVYMLLAHCFTMLVPGHNAFALNVFSALCSAITIFFLYRIIVLVLRTIKPGIDFLSECISAFSGSFILACSFTFINNSTQSEVYSLSLLMMAIIQFIMIRSTLSKAQSSKHSLFLSIYLTGLATAVHPIGLLNIFFIFFCIPAFDPSKRKNLIFHFLNCGILFLYMRYFLGGIYPEMLAGNFLRFQDGTSLLHDFLPLKIAAFLFPIALAWGYIALKKRNHFISPLPGFAFVLLLGFSTYTVILLRSAAGTPLNIGKPDNFASLSDYIQRRQYGNTPLWPRRYESVDQASAAAFRKYGAWNPAPFKPEYVQGIAMNRPDYSNMNNSIAGELSYLFRYQAWHMYMRYFLWNFAGIAGDFKDADYSFSTNKNPDIIKGLYLSGTENFFPYTVYGIPILLGIIGLYYQIRRTPLQALSFLFMFLVTGLLLALAQNQQEPQLRERDYFYTGSFLIWALWCAVGNAFLLVNIRIKALQYIIALCILAIPGFMLYAQLPFINRSNSMLSYDHAYNLLQSCDQDAILFTDSDNESYPLWYLQDIEGIRTDIRVVNITQAQSTGYLLQLSQIGKWGTKPVPLPYSSSTLQEYLENNKSIPPLDLPEQNLVLRPALSNDSLKNQIPNAITLNLRGMPLENGQYRFGIIHQLILHILKTQGFTRPVYFSQKVNPLYHTGLTKFLQQEGLALKIGATPAPEQREGLQYNDLSMQSCLLDLSASDIAYRNLHKGFRMSNLSRSGIYYDESERALIYDYRLLYIRYADNVVANGNYTMGQKVLNTMRKTIASDISPMNYLMNLQVADLYRRCGDTASMLLFAQKAVSESEKLLADPALFKADPYTAQFSPYIAAAEGYQFIGNTANAMKYLKLYLPETNYDPYLQNKIDEMELDQMIQKGQFQKAVDLSENLLKKYMDTTNKRYAGLIPRMEKKNNEIRQRAGLPALPTMSNIVNE
jgi:hypothetical protein